MRRFWQRAAFVVAVEAVAVSAYMLFEAQWLRVQRLTLPLPGLPDGLRGMRILHVSDLHAGAPGPATRAIGKFAERARDLEPDLVLFTGDMVDKKKDLSPFIGLLGGVGARLGKFAVLGNHDHGVRKTVLQDLARRFLGRSASETVVDYEDVDETVASSRRLLSEAGIELLENECRVLASGGATVQVCGIDDFQYGYGDLGAAAAQFDSAADLRILLTHSPDAVSRISGRDYQLVLAGHTHGGQICLPRPGGKILLSASGSEFGDGVYRVSGTTMHISRGVGTTLLPFRLMSRPEITLLEITAGEVLPTSAA